MGRSTTADNTSLGATRRHRCPRVRHRSDRQSDYVDVTIQQFAQVKHSVCFVLRALTYNIVSSIESSDPPSTSTLYPTTVSTSQPSVSHNTSHSLSPGVIGGIVAGVLSVLLVVTVALAWFMRRKHKKHHQYTSQRTVQQYPPLNGQGRTHARELATRVRSSVVRYGKRRAPTAVPNVDITIPRPSSVHSDHNATTQTTNSEPQPTETYDSEIVNGREVGYIINGRQLVVDLSSFPGILDRHGLRVTTVGGNMTEIPSDHGGQDSEAPPQYEE